MLTFLTWAPPGVTYMHCGMEMTWDHLRASYICGSCGAAR